VRTTIGGESLRIRLSNVLGAEPLTIDAASVGIHNGGGDIDPDSLSTLSFGGETFVVIPPGARVLSDPVDLAVASRQDLAVTIYVVAEANASTVHTDADRSSYLLPPGDFTLEPDLPAGSTVFTELYWLTGIDVLAKRTASAVATLGDSITDGFLSTLDANKRWPDELARRLNADRPGKARQVGVLNAGISGNQILTTLIGDNALARLDRDVLTQTGVRYVILLEGINDIGIPELLRLPPRSADDIIAGMKQVIARAHARGLRIYGGTLLPFRGAIYFTETGEVKRQAVNEWIRNSGAFDAVIDFDAALRDPGDPSSLLPLYDSGDGLHPSDEGYTRMGEIVDLDLFKAPPGKR
jgi:lysophospholipase L1-like esterase